MTALDRRALLLGTLAAAAARPVPCAPLRGSAPIPAPIPAGYRQVAVEHGIPPAILFAVALQESRHCTWRPGQRYALPWPWTLNIGQQALYFDRRAAALASLDAAVAAARRDVDIGLMQINWGWHHKRLVSTARALDPYVNLHLGATLLAECHAETGRWTEAIGRYHAPNDPARARAYAESVLRRVEALDHA